MDPGVVDDIINRLLEVKGSKPGKQVQLSEAEIRQLCVVSKEIFLQQPNLLELEAPIKICGKIFRLRLRFFLCGFEFNQVDLCCCVRYNLIAKRVSMDCVVHEL